MDTEAPNSFSRASAFPSPPPSFRPTLTPEEILVHYAIDEEFPGRWVDGPDDNYEDEEDADADRNTDDGAAKEPASAKDGARFESLSSPLLAAASPSAAAAASLRRRARGLTQAYSVNRAVTPAALASSAGSLSAAGGLSDPLGIVPADNIFDLETVRAAFRSTGSERKKRSSVDSNASNVSTTSSIPENEVADLPSTAGDARAQSQGSRVAAKLAERLRLVAAKTKRQKKQPSASKLSAQAPSNLDASFSEEPNTLDTSPIDAANTTSPNAFAASGSSPQSSEPLVTADELAINSPSFFPKKFLAIVHYETCYKDFDAGLARLRSSVTNNSSVVQNLVRGNFSEFVQAKDLIQKVYLDMRQSAMSPSAPYGTDKLSAALEVASTTAQKLFEPLLECRAEAERIKATIVLLERFKFLFNLPTNIRFAFQRGHFDYAVREFNKGRILVKSIYPDIIAKNAENTSASITDAATASNSESLFSDNLNSEGQGPRKSNHHPPPDMQNLQQWHLFNKVWSEVTNVMGHLKQQLISRLSDSTLSAEAHEQAISLIISIDPTVNPLFTYITNYGKWACRQLRDILEAHSLNSFKDAETNTPVLFKLNEFHRAIVLRNKKEFELMFSKNTELRIWQCIANAVRAMCEAFVSSLKDFWRVFNALKDIGGACTVGAGANSSGNVGTTLSQQRYARSTKDSSTKLASAAANKKKGHEVLSEVALYFTKLVTHVFQSTSEKTPDGINSSTRKINMSSSGSLEGGNLRHDAAKRLSIQMQQMVKPDSDNENEAPLPSFPNLTAFNSITVAHFAPRCLQSLVQCQEQLQESGMISVADEVAKVTMKIRSKLLDLHFASWEADAGRVPSFENWALEKFVTPTQRLFGGYQRLMVMRAFRAWSVGTNHDHRNRSSPGDSGKSGSFVDFVYPKISSTLMTYLREAKELALASSTTSAIDRETRILVFCINVDYITLRILPMLMETMETLLGESTTINSANLLRNLCELDLEAVTEFVKHQLTLLQSVLEKVPQLPVYERSTYEGNLVRPWVHHVLSEMVRVQALVIAASVDLLPRVMGLMYKGVMRLLRRCFVGVPPRYIEFNWRAARQTLAEVECVRSVLKNYAGNEANDQDANVSEKYGLAASTESLFPFAKRANTLMRRKRSSLAAVQILEIIANTSTEQKPFDHLKKQSLSLVQQLPPNEPSTLKTSKESSAIKESLSSTYDENEEKAHVSDIKAVIMHLEQLAGERGGSNDVPVEEVVKEFHAVTRNQYACLISKPNHV